MQTCVGTHLTTADGIFTFSMDRDEVRIIYHPDKGDKVHISLPAWKFNWVVKDFRSYIMPDG